MWKISPLSRLACSFRPLSPHGGTTFPVRPLPVGIVCTIGPSCQDEATIKKFIERGMTVARLNFSHGSHEYHRQTIKSIRKAARDMHAHLAIALDTKGLEVRTGGFTTPTVELKEGKTCYLTSNPQFSNCGTEERIYVGYDHLSRAVSLGSTILLSDGNVSLKVVEYHSEGFKCVVQNTFTLSGYQSVHLPGASMGHAVVSPQDAVDIALGVEEGVDFIFASFIRTAEDVRAVRSHLPQGKAAPPIEVFSKIESQEAIQNLSDIILASDGILIARGDLGMEIPLERVTLEQKRITVGAKAAGKPVICATQMLESMVDRPRPTRAEVADVTNAVLDGVDAVMLSGESAKGKYPVQAVSYMSRICHEALMGRRWRNDGTVLSTHGKLSVESSPSASPSSLSPLEALSKAAVQLAKDVHAKALLCSSLTIASWMTVCDPSCPIILATQSEREARQCGLRRGVQPMLMKQAPPSSAVRAAFCFEFLMKRNYAVEGGFIVEVGISDENHSHFIRTHTASSETSL